MNGYRRNRWADHVSRALVRAVVAIGLVSLPIGPAAADAGAAETSFFVGSGLGAVRLHDSVTSFKAMRDRHVVKQAFDYSCGAAALATLLTYGLDDPTKERDVLMAVLDAMPEDETAIRKKEGLSLLDLQGVAVARGHRAQGFRLHVTQVDKLRAPVIVFVRPRGYEHFAVLRGVRGDRVYLADPSRGNVRLPFYAFRDEWADDDGTGIIFVVEPAGEREISAESLFVSGPAVPRPELLSARQMLAIGNPYARFPQITP